MALAPAMEVKLGDEEVAIALGHGLFGSHLGIAYREEDGSPKLMHLAWHRTFRVESFPATDSQWIATALGLPPSRSSQALALLRMIAEKHTDHEERTDLGYGINALAGIGAIDREGAYAPAPECDGFTCSTIIVEMMRGIGVELIKINTWPQDEVKNEAWGRAIVCVMRHTGVPEAHILKVESNISGLRVRPEEVAAAADMPSKDRPADYLDLAPRADLLAKQMRDQCGPPPSPLGAPYEGCVLRFNSEVGSLMTTPLQLKLIAQAIDADDSKTMWAAVEAAAKNANMDPLVWADLKITSAIGEEIQLGLLPYAAARGAYECFGVLAKNAFDATNWVWQLPGRKEILEAQFVDSLDRWDSRLPYGDSEMSQRVIQQLVSGVAAYAQRHGQPDFDANEEQLALLARVKAVGGVSKTTLAAISKGIGKGKAKAEANDGFGIGPGSNARGSR